MQATRATEQSQDSRSQSSQQQDSQRNFTKLDERYGKIGILAVAGAVRHKCEQRKPSQSCFTPHDSD